MKKDVLQQATISLVKSTFGAVPFVGGALNEIAFDYRSRLKQDRLNKFIELLSDFFVQHPNVGPQSLKTEEFSDLFESVVRRALQTKSVEKHKRFRDVLAQQILHPTKETDSSEIYLDLISTLDEMAMFILSEHYRWGNRYTEIDPKRQIILDRLKNDGEKLNNLRRNFQANSEKIEKLDGKIKRNQAKVEEYNILVKSLQKFREPDFFNLTESEYLYYKQTLFSKGLLIDKGGGTYDGGKPFYYMWLTDFGQKFLDFITNP